MSAKTLITVVLLTFVAVSVGYLIVSESQAPAATKEPDPAESAARPAADSLTPRGGSADDADPARATAAEGVTAPADAAPGAARPAAAPHKVIAYYFHSTQRCMTCNKIERLAAEALRERFAEALEKGELEWRAVNMEEPRNTHFVQEYRLVASSLVLVDVHDGEQRDWTNMEKVWQYVHGDEVQFKQYVAEQVREYLES